MADLWLILPTVAAVFPAAAAIPAGIAVMITGAGMMCSGPLVPVSQTSVGSPLSLCVYTPILY